MNLYSSMDGRTCRGFVLENDIITLAVSEKESSFYRSKKGIHSRSLTLRNFRPHPNHILFFRRNDETYVFQLIQECQSAKLIGFCFETGIRFQHIIPESFKGGEYWAVLFHQDRDDFEIVGKNYEKIFAMFDFVDSRTENTYILQTLSRLFE